jgi:hypothetical protein
VARSPKVGAATVAALFSLFVGVEVASAGLVDDVVENPAAVVEEAVTDATQTADEAVADAEQAVDEAVAGAPEPVQSVAEKAQEVVANAPVAPVLERVEQAVVPIVAKTVDAARTPTTSPGTRFEAPVGVAEAPATVAAAAGSSTSTQTPTNVRTATSGNPSSRPAPVRSGSVHPSAPTTSLPAKVASALQRLAVPDWIAPLAAPEAAPAPDERDARSNAPWAPLAPLFPAETPATTAAAGAAGAALVAALLAALMFLAPRTGRLARPGPILVRPDPCLSLAERPG